jgi:3-hydroxy-9,10-secoandrosta-1,3,5(10)-triene-9,17-dione monooxygenase reductase component
MSVTPDQFKAALGRFCSGVTVITVTDEDGDHGMTASAFSSLSLEPPLVLVCVKKNGNMHQRLEKADGFAVNLLDQAQESVSNRFAGWWNEETSKWADLEVVPAPTSKAPWIGGSLASLDCTVHERFDGGDHTIYVGRVHDVRVDDRPRDTLEPLLYFAGQYRALAPKS